MILLNQARESLYLVDHQGYHDWLNLKLYLHVGRILSLRVIGIRDSNIHF